MKRLLWCVLLVIVSLSSLLAVDFGISVGTFDSYGRHESFNDGTHVQIGSVIGMSSHLEWEAFLIAEATPAPFSELVVGTALSMALVGPVFVDPQVDEVPPYPISMRVWGSSVEWEETTPMVHFSESLPYRWVDHNFFFVKGVPQPEFFTIFPILP